MSTLVPIDGVVYDLESSTNSPDGVSGLVGETARDDEEQGDPEQAVRSPVDGPY
jgi:hypothetical protein